MQCNGAHTNRSREVIESALVLLVLIGCAVFLSYEGRSHIVRLPSPSVKVISAPHRAFELWKDSGMRGRVLFLFDRRLNAENTGPSFEFSSDEFTGGLSAESLIKAIAAGGAGIPLAKHGPAIERLNGLLRATDLFDLWAEGKEGPPPVLPEDLRTLDKLCRRMGCAGDFDKLSTAQQRKVIERNRVLLEFLYPDACPKHKEYALRPDNYVYLTMKYGIARKIYHIIPDASWPEVENALRGYRLVTFSNGVFRMNLNEGIPVYVMRMENIKQVDEPVMVNVNGDFWEGSEFGKIARLLKEGVVRTDLVTVSGRDAEERAQELREYR